MPTKTSDVTLCITLPYNDCDVETDSPGLADFIKADLLARCANGAEVAENFGQKVKNTICHKKNIYS